MKNGSLLKNITDGFLILTTFIAIAFLVISFITFESEGYVVIHPRTEEEIEVKSFFDDPLNGIYALMSAGFFISSLVGFYGRKKPLASLVWSVIWMATVLFEYGSGLLGQIDYAYILFGGTAVIGNVVFLVCCKMEKKEEEMALKTNTEGEKFK